MLYWISILEFLGLGGMMDSVGEVDGDRGGIVTMVAVLFRPLMDVMKRQQTFVRV